MHKHAKQLAHAAGLCAVVCFAATGTMADDSGNSYSIGVEGFYDNYKEDAVSLDSEAYYGSVTANYTHNWTAFFAALDGRASYGRNNYSSSSGSTDGISQWEFEARPRVGYTFRAPGGSFSPYIGLGVRYFRDAFKGATTVSGGTTFMGYDRNILQVYIPVGFTYAHVTPTGWTIAPNLEYDQFVWGQVNSRLGTIPGFNNVTNTQDSGWGMRGSLMIGHEENNWSWQAGPFFRYWDIDASDLSDVGPFIGEEPPNTRLQVGIALRTVW